MDWRDRYDNRRFCQIRSKPKDFFDYLMQGAWFRETVDLFFYGRYKEIYEKIMADFLKKEIAVIDNEQYKTSVRP